MRQRILVSLFLAAILVMMLVPTAFAQGANDRIETAGEQVGAHCVTNERIETSSAGAGAH